MIFSKFGKLVKELFGKIVSFFDQVQIGYYFDCLVIALIVAIAFFSFGPSLDSSWGIIDDHEIFYFSPADHPMGVSEIIPTLLTKTEINPNSTLARFRPAYYFLRLVETRIWSIATPFPWYLARILIFIFFIICIYLFFRKFNGRIIGGILALIVAMFDFWNGIFSRLGPAETYAIIGLGFFLIGILILTKYAKSNFAWVLIMLGTVIAIGSKENMIVFLIPEIYLALLFQRKPLKSNLFPFAMIALSIVWTIWIYSTVLLRIKTNGSDVYENSIGVFDRFSILVKYASQNLVFTFFIGLLLIVGIIGYFSVNNKTLKPRFQNLMLGSTGIIALIVSQEIFYSGDIWGRYNFPYALFLPFTISLVVNFIQNLPVIHRKNLNQLSVFVISGLLLILFIQPSNLLIVRKISNDYYAETKEFESTLHDIEYYLSTNSASQVIFYGSKPEEDYERIVSIIRYLRSDSFLNDIYIYSNPPSDYETTFSKLNVLIEKQLIEWSTNGNPAQGIKPMSQFLDNPVSCLLINFSTDHPSSIACDAVINIKK